MLRYFVPDLTRSDRHRTGAADDVFVFLSDCSSLMGVKHIRNDDWPKVETSTRRKEAHKGTRRNDSES